MLQWSLFHKEKRFKRLPEWSRRGGDKIHDSQESKDRSIPQTRDCILLRSKQRGVKATRDWREWGEAQEADLSQRLLQPLARDEVWDPFSVAVTRFAPWKETSETSNFRYESLIWTSTYSQANEEGLLCIVEVNEYENIWIACPGSPLEVIWKRSQRRRT